MHRFVIYLYECDFKHGVPIAGRRSRRVEMPPCRKSREKCYEEAERRAKRLVLSEREKKTYEYDPDNPAYCGYNIAWEGEV